MSKFPPGFQPVKPSEADDYSRIDNWTKDLLNETMADDQSEQINLIDFYSPVQMLSNLFPQMSADAVEKLLAANGYDLDSALNQMYNDDSGKKKQVCRHFLSGGCYRKDCWFSHDLDAKVCKYWLMGSCNRGDSCQFMHGDQVYDKITSAPKIEPQGDDVPSDVVFNSLEFPTLGQTSNSNLVNFNTPNYGQLVKRTDKKDVKLESKTSLKQSKSSQIVDIPWVSTGDTLASSYFKHRESAIQVALERNKLFQRYIYFLKMIRATECYLSGNKAAAKAYSSQAQSLNSQLQSLHASASVKLFSERNPDWQKDGVVDLHGLHPQEISNILSMVFSQSLKSTLTLITGTGNHSRKSYSSLCPSVESFLNSQGVTWSLGSMADKRHGVYLVRLR
jgi:hypothetical protein